MQREKAEIMDEKAISRAVARISYEIIERNRGVDNLCLVGVIRRGATLARMIGEKISEIEGRAVEVGFLDITPYRDDNRGKTPPAADTELPPFGTGGRRVVIVDDVVFTGRSARAAIDAVVRLGRPERIELAALIDRGHRELPIRPDYIGKNVPTSRTETVAVMLDEYDGVNRVAIYEETDG